MNKKDGPLFSCPWCAERLEHKISGAQISHLITCGDKRQATLAAVRARVENAKQSLAENNHRGDWSTDKVAAFILGLEDALTPAPPRAKQN